MSSAIAEKSKQMNDDDFWDLEEKEAIALNKGFEEKREYRSKLVFPEFNSIKVSTKTFIVMTNLILDIDRVFNFLPVTDYILIPKRRGRKKKIEPVDPNINIVSGSIITLEYQNNIRGVDLKKKKKNKDMKKRGNYFRNSFTIVMIIEGKKINYKVSSNGKLQMTGCKHDEQAEQCVKWFWYYIKDNNDLYHFSNTNQMSDKKKILDLDTPLKDKVVGKYTKKGSVALKNESDVDVKIIPDTFLKIIFIPAMRNIDFSLNFFVDREKLDEYFNTCTDYHSLLETSFGYTGVNIKIPIKKHIQELMLKQIIYKDGEWGKESFIPYRDYLCRLPDKDIAKKLKKPRYNTFLVFHSGKTIMSGMESTFMHDEYYEFLNIIRDCHDIIEERLVE
jgi:TATA-box binding protein (TBP) (component of TFIID and TFIIIB)